MKISVGRVAAPLEEAQLEFWVRRPYQLEFAIKINDGKLEAGLTQFGSEARLSGQEATSN